MIFTLYGAAGSGSVPVEATLRLIGQDYRVIEAPTWEGEAERRKVASVNPMRQGQNRFHPPPSASFSSRRI